MIKDMDKEKGKKKKKKQTASSSRKTSNSGSQKAAATDPEDSVSDFPLHCDDLTFRELEFRLVCIMKLQYKIILICHT